MGFFIVMQAYQRVTLSSKHLLTEVFRRNSSPLSLLAIRQEDAKVRSAGQAVTHQPRKRRTLRTGNWAP